MVFGPIPETHAMSAPSGSVDLGCNDDFPASNAKFIKAEIVLQDQGIGHGQAQIALCIAISEDECPPPAREFRPVDSSRFFYSPLLALDRDHAIGVSGHSEFDAEMKGWGAFQCMYERVLKAAQYAKGLGLTGEELDYFKEHGNSFGGYSPTFGPQSCVGRWDFCLLYTSPSPRD